MKKLLFMMAIMLIVSIPSMANGMAHDSIAKDTTAIEARAAEVDASMPERENAEYFDTVMDNMSTNIVPVVGIVFTLGMPVLIVFVVMYFEHKKKKAKYELAAKIIESGKEIPNGLFADVKTEGKNILTKGITTTFTGLGLTILLFALVNAKIASVGLMILCIGVGQIIIHMVMKPSSKEKAGQPDASQNDRSQENESI